jgi:transposase-like protein
MSKQVIEAIARAAMQPYQHGFWARFCREHGVSRDQVYHWRRKLGLPVRA